MRRMDRSQPKFRQSLIEFALVCQVVGMSSRIPASDYVRIF